MNKLTIASILVLASFALSSFELVESASVSDYMSSTKNYLAELVRKNIIARSEVLQSFDKTMSTIRDRYEVAKKDGSLKGKDEQEVYMKIVVDEIRKLREQLGNEKAEEDSAAGGFMQACANADCKVSAQYDMMQMDELDDDDDDEAELMNELDEIEKLKIESEMGWGLDPESKQALTQRTLALLGDLLQNELKNIVMILITGLATGGPTVGPVTAAFNVSLKFKLIEYLSHSIMDMAAALLGKKIEPLSPKIEPRMSFDAEKQESEQTDLSIP